MESVSNPGIYPEQELTQKILDRAFAVHNSLGCGFLEKVYSNALFFELGKAGLRCEQEVPFKSEIQRRCGWRLLCGFDCRKACACRVEGLCRSGLCA